MTKGSTEPPSLVKPATLPRLDWRMGQAAAAYGNQLSVRSAGNPRSRLVRKIHCIALFPSFAGTRYLS
jgi:hypothetical protein